MPGNTYAETPEANQATMSTANRLQRHVEVLANEIGGRSIYNTTELETTKTWIISEFRKLDFKPRIQTYQIESGLVEEAIEQYNKRLKDEGCATQLIMSSFSR